MDITCGYAIDSETALYTYLYLLGSIDATAMMVENREVTGTDV